MAYFNPIVYFIKSFIRLFTRKFFWVLLIIIILFFILFFNDKALAFSISDLSVSNFSSSDVENIYDIIENNKEDYDSVFVRYLYSSSSPNRRITFSFYNFSDLGRLYISPYYEAFNYTVNSENSLSGSVKYMTYSYPDFTYSATRYDNNINLGIRDLGTTMTTTSDNYFVTNRTIYSNNTFNTVWFQATDKSIKSVNPYFITTDEELQTFDFDYLQINGGTTKYESYFEPLNQTYTAEFKLTYYYKGVATNIDILPEYIAVNTQENTWQINIPYNVLTNKVIVRNGEKFSYRFSYKNGYESGFEMTTGELIYNLTTEQEQDINADSEKQLQGQILESQQQTNDKLDNLESTINDSNIDNITDDTLPSDDTTDITRDGVNGIFTSIYNAFCTGNAQDIVFPIPFTNKNITLQANYVNNMLSSNGAGWVVTIIQAFWWYLISRFIIKDVMDKINKIKSGNIEDIETSNIRGDML